MNVGPNLPLEQVLVCFHWGRVLPSRCREASSCCRLTRSKSPKLALWYRNWRGASAGPSRSGRAPFVMGQAVALAAGSWPQPGSSCACRSMSSAMCSSTVRRSRLPCPNLCRAHTLCITCSRSCLDSTAQSKQAPQMPVPPKSAYNTAS